MIKHAKKFNIPLQIKIIFLVISVSILTLVLTNYLSSKSIEETTFEKVEEKTKDISNMVALRDDVIGTLKGEIDQETLQTDISEIRRTTDVLFITVLDMDRIRLTHPIPEEVGRRFVGGDEDVVYTNGLQYSSVGEGTLGYSVRYFTPVFDDDGTQVGAVVVGMLLDDVEKAVSENRSLMILGTVLSLFIGISAAIFLSVKIKEIMFGMEPWEISKQLEERSAMLQYAKEGIVAVDDRGIITLINNEAIHLFNEFGQDTDLFYGKSIDEVLPNVKMLEVLKTGIRIIDQEFFYNGNSFVTNVVPIYVDDNIVGVVATFRDKTEFKVLAEKLTGVKLYADALRAQAHEFKNKMHVILGLVELNSYDELAQYIKHTSENLQTEIGFITNQIKDPILAGFLLGKLSFAREQGVELEIDENCHIPYIEDSELAHDLVTIAGNLIDNAIDAVQGLPTKKVFVSIILKKNTIYLSVSDTGKGMTESEIEQSTKMMYSTKDVDRGWGLYLVSQVTEQRKGELAIQSAIHSGTEITLQLPYSPRSELDD